MALNEINDSGHIRKTKPVVFKHSLFLEQQVSNVQMWPLMNILDQAVRNKVHLVYAFGVNATEVIFTTMDRRVCFGC